MKSPLHLEVPHPQLWLSLCFLLGQCFNTGLDYLFGIIFHFLRDYLTAEQLYHTVSQIYLHQICCSLGTSLAPQTLPLSWFFFSRPWQRCHPNGPSFCRTGQTLFSLSQDGIQILSSPMKYTGNTIFQEKKSSC